ncbi:MAG: SsrA-binding protein SmpB, partial [Bacillota bacterium]|nr:SsrA-binding protein SmpB [Bacillota bacterium]
MAERKILENNKKARHDYFFDDLYECGIELTGTEIKSLRAGGASLRDSFAKIVKGEVFVFNMHIAPYDKGNIYNTNPLRPKKLLLHKKEIRKLDSLVMQKGVTLIPSQIYLNEKGMAKLELAVARGKKLYDKREDIARKDAARDAERR